VFISYILLCVPVRGCVLDLYFVKVWNFNCWYDSECQCASPCQIVCQSVKSVRRYGNFSILSKWQLSIILNWFYVILDQSRRAFGGLCHCAKFVSIRCSSFDNM